jgi:hypothetical protein
MALEILPSWWVVLGLLPGGLVVPGAQPWAWRRGGKEGGGQ